MTARLIGRTDTVSQHCESKYLIHILDARLQCGWKQPKRVVLTKDRGPVKQLKTYLLITFISRTTQTYLISRAYAVAITGI